MPGVFEVIYEWDDAEAQAWFDYAGYKSRRASEPLGDAAEAILDQVRTAFETEGGSIGEPWDDLAVGYQDEKLARYGHVYPILIGDGDLYEAATTRTRAIHTRSGADGGLLEYAVRTPYAAFHQQPDGPGTGKMPHRPFFSLNAELIDEIDRAFEHWLDDLRTANARRAGAAVNPFGGIL